jgi:hypothetical protein
MTIQTAGEVPSPLNWRMTSFAMSAAKSSAAFCRMAPSRSTPPRSPPIWRKMISRSCVRQLGPDHPGGSEIGGDYEDYVKSIVNPDNPTPRGWGYQLPNPDQNGDLVYYDDCQQSTGMMVEAKGGYSGVLEFQQGRDSVSADWLHQSAAQLAAAGGRPIRWYFAEPETKAFAEKLFRSAGGGRDRIETKVLTWPGSAP